MSANSVGGMVTPTPQSHRDLFATNPPKNCLNSYQKPLPKPQVYPEPNEPHPNQTTPVASIHRVQPTRWATR